MSLKGTASQTLQILDAGYFLTPDGRRIDIEAALKAATEGTKLYTPSHASAVFEKLAQRPARRAKVEVTDETTQVAARRVVVRQRRDDSSAFRRVFFQRGRSLRSYQQ
ncbi:MAG: DUF2263 domain-containing protein [Planctomycetaceae bacterium]